MVQKYNWENRSHNLWHRKFALKRANAGSRGGVPENAIRQLENNLTCRRAVPTYSCTMLAPKMFLCQLKVFSHPSSRDPVRYDGALSLYGASFPIAAYVVVVTRPDTFVLVNLGKISIWVFWLTCDFKNFSIPNEVSASIHSVSSTLL